ncbi:hypothetical protein PCO87_14315 [Pectobacteriaceae bacterium C52]|nr:hypothetical protein PCO87_14020 [Pectobacteriaceae bacterium C52]WJV61092.1 hypothetical protein PCO87_14315 [Pectobacteriaceae bacterium C52]
MKTTKQTVNKFRIQYRQSGTWVNGNAYPTRKEADDYARFTGRDYQIVKA